jgi:chemotaxis protein histidine kinase CheA
VTLEANGVRVAADRLRRFWSSFAHIVRNAVDHGVESPDERVAAGKPPVSQIELQARLVDDTMTIAITDDGRGIAWDLVRAKAAAAGLPAESREDLETALFSDGISTATTITETSGRGVGLAAVQAVVRELGGRIAVTSEPGRGARFVFSFPAATVGAQRFRRTSVGTVFCTQELAR